MVALLPPGGIFEFDDLFFIGYGIPGSVRAGLLKTVSLDIFTGSVSLALNRARCPRLGMWTW